MTHLSPLERDLEQVRQLTAAVRDEVGKVVVGQTQALEGLLVACLAGGHVLVESVPGLGKTLLVRSVARTLSLSFKRIQCTPDLMPADIIGTRILEEGPDGRKRFSFQPGPVFTHVLLTDEINRTTPRTQAALLEAMEECAVTLAGEKRVLQQPFFVMATQNPVEMHGTFPLPEAQLDRFFFKLRMDMPSLDEMEEIIDRTTGDSSQKVQTVVGREEILQARNTVRQVLMPRPVKRFALRLAQATDPSLETSPREIRRFVRYGAGPRGAQALILAAKAKAVIEGRPNAAFEDVRWAALPALRHRLVLSFEGEAEGVDTDSVIETVLGSVSEVASRLEKEAAFVS